MQASDWGFEESSSSAARKQPRVGLRGIVAEGTLIEVEYHFLLTMCFDEILGKDLSQYYITLVILVNILRDTASVFHTKPLLQYLINSLPFNFDSSFIQELFLNRSNVEEPFLTAFHALNQRNKLRLLLVLPHLLLNSIFFSISVFLN